MVNRGPAQLLPASPAEIIAHAEWLYLRFPLGLRMIEHMLAARGIVVPHQMVGRWAEKYKACLCQRDPLPLGGSVGREVTPL